MPGFATRSNAPTAQAKKTRPRRGWLKVCAALVTLATVWVTATLAIQPPLAPLLNRAKPAVVRVAANNAQPDAAAPADNPNANAATTDPLARALLQTNPDTPAEQLDAVKILIGRKEYALAKGFLQQVLAANLPEDQAVALWKKHGTGFFMQLARTSDLEPEGAAAADFFIGTATQWANNPDRIAGELARLSDEEIKVRRAALKELRYAGTNAAPALVQLLLQTESPLAVEAASVGIASLKSDGLGPVLAALDHQPPAGQLRLLGVLRTIASPQATPALLALAWGSEPAPDPQVQAEATDLLRYLLAGVPAPEEAVRSLLQEARQHYLQPSLTADLDGLVEVWNWNAETALVEVSRVSPFEASGRLAFERARQAVRIAPENEQAQRLFMVTSLALPEQQLRQWRPNFSQEASVEALEQALLDSRASGNTVTAVAAARQLGTLDAELVIYRHLPEISPLVDAAKDGDRRLRFVALESIIKLNPQHKFPGASHVVEALAFFINTSGARRAVVAGRLAGESQQLAGYLNQLGFETDVVHSGPALVSQVVQSADLDLILLDATMPPPTAAEIVDTLRQDGRTAAVPVGMVLSPLDLDKVGASWLAEVPLRSLYPASAEDLAAGDYRGNMRPGYVLPDFEPVMVNMGPAPRAGAESPFWPPPPTVLVFGDWLMSSQELANFGFLRDADPLTGVIVRPTKVQDLDLQLARLLSLAGPHAVGWQERAGYTTQSLTWANQLLAKDAGNRETGIYDWSLLAAPVAKASFVPEYTAACAQIIARLPDRNAQRNLIQLFMASSGNPQLRRQIGEAITENVKRFGICVTRQELVENPQWLAALKTTQAQKALLDLASHPRQQIRLRRRAATAFSESVDLHGLLLSEADSQLQFERYNHSLGTSLANQQLLSDLLDVVERGWNARAAQNGANPNGADASDGAASRGNAANPQAAASPQAATGRAGELDLGDIALGLGDPNVGQGSPELDDASRDTLGQANDGRSHDGQADDGSVTVEVTDEE